MTKFEFISTLAEDLGENYDYQVNLYSKLLYNMKGVGETGGIVSSVSTINHMLRAKFGIKLPSSLLRNFEICQVKRGRFQNFKKWAR